MYLHNTDRELFSDMIFAVSETSNIRADIIEKDYYVTLILQELSKTEYPIVFKGGTSLSKAYGIIDRFSEDIDITFTEHLGESRRKKLKYNILKPISERLNLSIENWNTIESDKDLNHYDFYYNSVIDNIVGAIPAYVKIETSLMSYSFPTNECMISNYIYDQLKDLDPDLIQKYQLQPFPMKVQALERTMIDKIFAVCDYYLLNRPKKNARHLYDIYKLQKYIKIDNTFLDLVKEVRAHRCSLGDKIAPSAKNTINIQTLASEICQSDFYAQDYADTTVFMISDGIRYETVKSNYLNLVNQIWTSQVA